MEPNGAEFRGEIDATLAKLEGAQVVGFDGGIGNIFASKPATLPENAPVRVPSKTDNDPFTNAIEVNEPAPLINPSSRELNPDAVPVNLDAAEIELTPGQKKPRLPFQERLENNPELSALVERSKILKSAPMRHLLDMVRRDPDMHTFMKAWMERKSDLLEGTFNEGSESETKAESTTRERNRVLAPLLSGLYRHPEAAEMADMAVSEIAELKSDELKERIKKGARRAPLVFIGAGWHSGIIQNEIMSRHGSNPAITFDQNKEIGGTFWLAPEAFWYLNSRQRPQSQDTEPLPGTSGDINPQGRGILGVADITTTDYPTSQEVGRTIRTNFLNAGHAVLGMDLVRIDENDGDEFEGVMKLTFKDVDTGELQEIYTDEMVITSGLGEAAFRYLDRNDRETRKIIAEEMEKFGRGEIPAVMTGEMRRIISGQKGNRFPLEAFKEGTGYIGWGDETRIQLEHDFGHGPGKHSSVAQMDFMSEVTIIADKVPLTKEEAAQQERPRYAGNTLDFPRADEDYFSRINPIQGRVRRLERNREDPTLINVIYQNKDGSQESVTLKHVIFNTGYQDKTETLLQNLPICNRLEIGILGDEITDVDPAQVLKKDTVITYDTGRPTNRSPFEQVRVLDLDTREGKKKVTIQRTTVQGETNEPEEFFLETTDDRESFVTSFLNTRNVTSVKIPGRGPSLTRQNSLDDQTGDTALSEQVGQRVYGWPITIAGPAAKLQPTDVDRSRTSAFDLAKENVAAAFFYEPKDQIIGGEIADELNDGMIDFEGNGVLTPTTSYDVKPIELQIPDDTRSESAVPIPVSEFEPLSDNISSADIVRWQLRSHLEPYLFPANFPEELKVSISRVIDSGKDRKSIEFIVQTNIELADRETAGGFFSGFVKDPKMASALMRIADASYAETTENLEISGSFEITIPIQDRRAEVGDVTLRNSYRTVNRDGKPVTRYHTL